MAYIDEDVIYTSIEKKYKSAKGGERKAYLDVLNTICEMPRAEAEWISEGLYRPRCSLCSVCSCAPTLYCPHCGAKMEGIKFG